MTRVTPEQRELAAFMSAAASERGWSTWRTMVWPYYLGKHIVASTDGGSDAQ